jgi:IMP dehydrogenase
MNTGQDSKTPANQKLVPEGSRVEFYKGPLADYVFQLVGGLRAGMGYQARTIDELRTAPGYQVTSASVQESHPHDIVITQEAPNY